MTVAAVADMVRRTYFEINGVAGIDHGLDTLSLAHLHSIYYSSFILNGAVWLLPSVR